MAEMGMVPRSCEIVESDESDSRFVWPGRSKKDIMSKDGRRYAIEEDINRLLEAVIRASGRGQTSQEALTKKAMKRPVRAGWSPPSTSGISTPASLKQALRGICISQASELAAMRRLSKPQHPSLLGMSEVRSAGINSAALQPMEPTESSYTIRDRRENIKEILGAPEVNVSTSTVNQSIPFPVTRVLDPAASTSAASNTKISKARVSEKLRQLGNAKIHAEAGTRKQKMEWGQNGPRLAAGATFTVVTDEKVSSNVIVPSSARAVSDNVNESEVYCAPSSSVQCNKNKHPSKTHLIKPFLWSKNKPKKKVEQGPCSSSNSCSFRPNVEVNFVPIVDCVPCETHDNAPKGITDVNACRLPTDGNHQAVDSFDMLHPNTNCLARLKPTETKFKVIGDFSQSSKSSTGDFSCSTSISEESSFIQSSLSGRRPHMSKDLRWESINHIQKLYGSLSLTHFKLLKKLGCGDIGTVYLAELRSTNSMFAVKVMDNEFLTSINKMSRAKTEREIMQMLDHPFLPTLYAYFTADKFSCLVMEYCCGGDLHVLRQKQPGRCFSEQAARFYGAEILLALEYLHLQGVVYRDLKPENILVREDGHIMLTDFDLSLRCSVHPTLLKSSSAPTSTTPRKTVPSSMSTCMDPFCTQPMWKVPCFTPAAPSFTVNPKNLKSDPAAQVGSLPQLIVEPINARSNSFVGTHEYLAPEIINGDGHGSAVDWWTFGIFLYELLYGKTPFKGQTNEDTLANVVFQPLTFPQSPIVSFHAKDLIRGLLTKDPVERLGSVRGAAAIKLHSFFQGLNWALVRFLWQDQSSKPFYGPRQLVYFRFILVERYDRLQIRLAIPTQFSSPFQLLKPSTPGLLPSSKLPGSSTGESSYEYKMVMKVSFEVDHKPDLCQECRRLDGRRGVGLKCFCHLAQCVHKVVTRSEAIRYTRKIFFSFLLSTGILFGFILHKI